MSNELVESARTFMSENPDYADTPENFAAMNAVIAREKLDPTRIGHLERAWKAVKAESGSSTASAHPVSEDPVEREAHRLIAEGIVTKESIAAMTNVQLQRAATSAVFCKILEILEPRREPTPATRGDVVVALDRASRNGTTLDAEIARASARPASAPVSRPSAATQRQTGILDIHRGQGFRKPSPKLRECLSQEQKDAAWLEEQRTKSGRAQRVRAHRNR